MRQQGPLHVQCCLLPPWYVGLPNGREGWLHGLRPQCALILLGFQVPRFQIGRQLVRHWNGLQTVAALVWVLRLLP